MNWASAEGRPRRALPWPAKGELPTPRAAAEELARECEAFLNGHSADLLVSRHKPVGAWAWLNQVAHATPEEVTALAARAVPWNWSALRLRELRSRRWQRAVAEVASDLVSLSGQSPRVLERLQAYALIPLELELARPAQRYRMTPEALVIRARVALYRGRARLVPKSTDLGLWEPFFRSGGRYGLEVPNNKATRSARPHLGWLRRLRLLPSQPLSALAAQNNQGEHP